MAAVRAEARVAIPYFLLGFLFVMAIVPWVTIANPFEVTKVQAASAMCATNN